MSYMYYLDVTKRQCKSKSKRKMKLREQIAYNMQKKQYMDRGMNEFGDYSGFRGDGYQQNQRDLRYTYANHYSQNAYSFDSRSKLPNNQQSSQKQMYANFSRQHASVDNTMFPHQNIPHKEDSIGLEMSQVKGEEGSKGRCKPRTNRLGIDERDRRKAELESDLLGILIGFLFWSLIIIIITTLI
jgi:hypothetical protein